MPSAFDKIFADTALPTLFSTFAVTIEITKDAEGFWTEFDAQIGRETARRKRVGDGWNTVQTREVLVSAAALAEFLDLSNPDDSPIEQLGRVRHVRVEGVAYVVIGFDRAPGGMTRLSLERSDPGRISRPNLGGRR